MSTDIPTLLDEISRGLKGDRLLIRELCKANRELIATWKKTPHYERGRLNLDGPMRRIEDVLARIKGRGADADRYCKSEV